MRERLSGNEAIAIAMRQINPDVMPAFPITPSTEVPSIFQALPQTARLTPFLCRLRVNTAP